mgnify:CR=1 FL=1
MQQPPIYLDINNNKSIINALKAGEEYVFDAVYRHYFRRLCAFCSQYVSEQEEIEEIVQDTMMWLWENRCNLMEELTLTTPSILFSAISLIMLAYTNRFLAYAQVIRNLKGEHENRPSAMTKLQLDNLRKRLYMARSMQIYGVISLLLCVVCTFFIYIGLQTLAVYTFGVALLLLVISLGISVKEILISVKALEFRLDNVTPEEEKK